MMSFDFLLKQNRGKMRGRQFLPALRLSNTLDERKLRAAYVALRPALCSRSKTAFQKFRNEIRELAIFARRPNFDAAHDRIRKIECRLHNPEFQKNGFLSRRPGPRWYPILKSRADLRSTCPRWRLAATLRQQLFSRHF
jgi:hypothetical protein